MVAFTERARLAERIAATPRASGRTAHDARQARELFADLTIGARPAARNDNRFPKPSSAPSNTDRSFPHASVEHARAISHDLFTWSSQRPELSHTGRRALRPRAGDPHPASPHPPRGLPERFVSGPPRPETLPTAVWINRPSKPTRQQAPDPTIVTPDDPQPGVINGPYAIPQDRSLLLDRVESHSKC